MTAKYPRTLQLAERDSGAELFPSDLFTLAGAPAAPDPAPLVTPFDDARGLTDVFGPVIHSYTRRQAIEDGVLVALEDEHAASAREAATHVKGDSEAARIMRLAFRDVCYTVAAFHLAVWPIDNEEQAAWLESRAQDLRGRLWDTLWMLAWPCNVPGALERLQSPGLVYSLHCVLAVAPPVKYWRHGPARRGRHRINLRAVLAGNDQGAPCLTIMLPEED